MLSKVELEVLDLFLDSRQDAKLIALVNKAVMFAGKSNYEKVTLDHLIYIVLNEIEEEANYWYPDDTRRKEILKLLRKEQYLEWLKERNETSGKTIYASISLINFLKTSYNVKSKFSTLDIFKRVIETSFCNNTMEIPELFLHCSRVSKIEEILDEKPEPKPKGTTQKSDYVVESEGDSKKHKSTEKVSFKIIDYKKTVQESKEHTVIVDYKKTYKSIWMIL